MTIPYMNAPKELIPDMFIQAVRTRPGMYIGDLNMKGLENAIEDFFESLECKKTNSFFNTGLVSLVLESDDTIFIKAESIHADKYINFYTQNAIKFDGLDFSYLSLPILGALSEKAEITVEASMLILNVIYEKGDYSVKMTDVEQYAYKHGDQVIIRFKIDRDLFDPQINDTYLRHFLEKYSFTNAGIKVQYENAKSGEKVIFSNRRGMIDKMDLKLHFTYTPDFRFDGFFTSGERSYQLSFCYLPSYSYNKHPFVETYVNTNLLAGGGSLENGIIKGIRSFLRAYSLFGNDLYRRLILFASVRGGEFNFEGSTKSRLKNKDVENNVKLYVVEELKKNPNSEKLIQIFTNKF